MKLFHYTNLELIFYKILQLNCYGFASISEKWAQNFMSIGKADQVLNFKYQLDKFVIDCSTHVNLLAFICQHPHIWLLSILLFPLWKKLLLTNITIMVKNFPNSECYIISFVNIPIYNLLF